VPILFDFALYAPGFASAVSATDKMRVGGKRVCVVTVPGNRPDWTFSESAAALAGHFQRYVCYESELYRRGRAPDEIAARLKRALVEAGVGDAAVSVAGSYDDAARLIVGEVTPADLVVVFGANSQAMIECYRKAFAEAVS
jgi:cyanophycin synthetase